jgi:hypothetical protein
MILVPYFIERLDDWISVNIFLSSGGRELWNIDQEKDKQILKMLKENGFPVKTLEKKSGLIYAEIDRSKLDLSTFYTWDEIDPETSEEDVWRKLMIPVSLWSCPIFRESYVRGANLPMGLEYLLNKV